MDKVKGNNISTTHLTKGADDSMLSKAYQYITTYYAPHIRYDKHYNVSIDNPYNTSIASQIIIPIASEDEAIGIIRFTKYKNIFELDILKKLLALESTFIKIFHRDTNTKVRDFNKDFFSISPEQAFNIIDKN